MTKMIKSKVRKGFTSKRLFQGNTWTMLTWRNQTIYTIYALSDYINWFIYINVICSFVLFAPNWTRITSYQ
jgi:hypothetical protein